MRRIELTPDQSEWRAYFPYSPEILEALRVFPRRRFSGNGSEKYWSLAPCQENAEHLLVFARENDFEITDDALAFSRTLLAQEQPILNADRWIRIEADGRGRLVFAIWWDFSPELLAATRKIPDARFVDRNGKHWVAGLTQAIHVARLATEHQFNISPEAKPHLDNAGLREQSLVAEADRRKGLLAKALEGLEAVKVDGNPLFAHQISGARILAGWGSGILADGLGCISGDTVLKINRAGKGFQITFAELYEKFNNPSVWKPGFRTTVKSLMPDGELRHNEIVSVLISGVKETYTVTLASGKQIRATANHEFATPNGFRPLSELSIDSEVLTNGEKLCADCGNTEQVISGTYAKFPGICRRCMYRYRRNNPSLKSGVFSDGKGYLRVSGQFDHPYASGTSVFEHRAVMEKHIGRYLEPTELVHHKNGVKTDNRLENLEIVTASEHAKEHATEAKKHLTKDKHGNEIIWVPRIDRIVSIEPYGSEPVYDLVMAEPARNFVANGIIVHNSGKTRTSMMLAKAYQRAFGCKVIIVCPVSLKDGWAREAALSSVQVSVYSWAKVPEPPTTPYVLFADEATAAQNLASQRTQKFLELALDGKCLGVYPITGTPMRMGRPKHLFPLLQSLRHPLSLNRKDYENRFCAGHFEMVRVRGGAERRVWKADGASDLQELRKLTADCILQRTKEECLDLPPKTRVIRPVEMSADAQAAYDAKFNEARARYLQRVEQGIISDGAEEIVMLGLLRQAASIGKVESAIEIAEEIIEQDGSIVLFTDFVDSAKAIAEAARTLCKVELLTGETKQSDRQVMVDRFQRRDSRVWISTLKAGGVGLTLTAASTVVLVDRSWAFEDALQAEDRTHRAGSRWPVTAIWLQATKTDKMIDDRLFQQKIQSEQVLKGERTSVRRISSAEMAKQICLELFGGANATERKP